MVQVGGYQNKEREAWNIGRLELEMRPSPRWRRGEGVAKASGGEARIRERRQKWKRGGGVGMGWKGDQETGREKRGG